MHGVVGTDDDLRPDTDFVTWRDARRFGGRVMSDWFAHGERPSRCLPVCALCAGIGSIDAIFLHSWYPGGRTLDCRASLVGGAAWASLRDRLGLTWEEMNATDDPRVGACARRIVEDLFGNVDLSSVTELVGVGNALTLNPALRKAVERRSGRVCRLPGLPEMAACGAEFHAMDSRSKE